MLFGFSGGEGGEFLSFGGQEIYLDTRFFSSMNLRYVMERAVLGVLVA